MKYNFDKVIDRNNTSCVKWDYLDSTFGRKDIIPMWVADMDFETPEVVVDAVKKRAAHGIYGYTERPDGMYEAVMEWLLKRHDFKTEKNWFLFTPGIVSALNMAVLSYSNPGDKIIVQNPVYHPFSNAVTRNGRQLVSNSLKFENGRYVMDFEDLERKIDQRVRMLILCSPHNPVGRVWTRDELVRLEEICLKNNIVVVSDEIHSDLIYKDYKHIPLASISDEFRKNTITCIAPSKTFNIAGLGTSAVIIPDQLLRRKFRITLENMGLDMSNVFGITAFEAAYKFGEEWLTELLDYLDGNLNFLVSYIKNNIPELEVVRPEGTYLVWLDCRKLNMSCGELNSFMVSDAGVGLDDGCKFGAEGEGFQRINIACPRSILEEGLIRIEAATSKIRSKV